MAPVIAPEMTVKMKKYTVDISFDPPPDPNLDPKKWNDPGHDHDYVHVRLESSSRRCVEWLRDILLTTRPALASALVVHYPIKVEEAEESKS